MNSFDAEIQSQEEFPLGTLFGPVSWSFTTDATKFGENKVKVRSSWYARRQCACGHLCNTVLFKFIQHAKFLTRFCSRPALWMVAHYKDHLGAFWQWFMFEGLKKKDINNLWLLFSIYVDPVCVDLQSDTHWPILITSFTLITFFQWSSQVNISRRLNLKTHQSQSINTTYSQRV